MATQSFAPSASSFTGTITNSDGIKNAVGCLAENPTSKTSKNWYASGSPAVDSVYAEYTFDLSSIPSAASNIQVSCIVSGKAESSAYSRTSDGRYSEWGLCCNGEAKGEHVHTIATSRTLIEFDNTGSWTRAELDGLQLRHYVSKYGGITYGATLTISYSTIAHGLTIENTIGVSISPSESGEYGEGEIVPIIISETTMPKVTVDGADVTSLFVKKVLDESYSCSASNSSYNGSVNKYTQIASVIGMSAENPHDDSLNWYGSKSATVDSEYAEYTFDLTSIPSDATDIVVKCKVAGTAESTSYSHQSGGKYSVWGLCCNGEAKGSQIHTTNSAVTVIKFTDTGSWTRAELDGLQLRHYVGYYGGSTNGITLTIEYSTPDGEKAVYVYNLTMDADHVLVVSNSGGSTTLFVNVSGAWKAVSKVWQKKNGVWAEADVATLFADASDNSNSGYYIDL